MPKLDDSKLLDILNKYEGEARSSLSTRIAIDNNTTMRYDGELYGNEIDGHSKVVSQDVKDTVESDMPSLIRAILNSGPICKFQPNDPENEADVREAQEKTDFADYIIRGKGGSYKINYDFIKSVDMYQCGALKYMFDEEESSFVEEYENVPLMALPSVENEILSTPNYSEHEVKKSTDNEDGTITLKVKIKTKKQEIKIIPVPNETLLISNEAADQYELAMIGDISTITRGGLLAQGFEKKIVEKLSTTRGNSEGETSRQLRFDESGNMNQSDYGEWANQLVEIVDMYPLIDYNQDGIAERMHIIKSGDFILLKEQFDHAPYAIASAVPTPYSAIGNGRAIQVESIQLVKTSLERGMLDNVYAVNNVETHINENVNIDDQQSDEIGKIVRHKGDVPPANNIQNVVTPSIIEQALLAKQDQDQKKAKLVGNQIASQGLTADDVNGETATRFKGVQKAEAAKLELVIRNIVEIGYRKLSEGVVWMAQKFQTDQAVINSNGKSLRIDPSKWRLSHSVTAEIGLGTGNNEETVNNLSALWQISSQLKAEGSPLTDEAKRFNILSDLTQALELKSASRYFNNPEEPSELLMADNEKLNAMVIQMQEQLQVMQQQVQNPLVEAETIKARKDLMESQEELRLNWAKFNESQRQFDIKQSQAGVKQTEDTAIKLTQMELNSGKNVPGSVV